MKSLFINNIEPLAYHEKYYIDSSILFLRLQDLIQSGEFSHVIFDPSFEINNELMFTALKFELEAKKIHNTVEDFSLYMKNLSPNNKYNLFFAGDFSGFKHLKNSTSPFKGDALNVLSYLDSFKSELNLNIDFNFIQGLSIISVDLKQMYFPYIYEYQSSDIEFEAIYKKAEKRIRALQHNIDGKDNSEQSNDYKKIIRNKPNELADILNDFRSELSIFYNKLNENAVDYSHLINVRSSILFLYDNSIENKLNIEPEEREKFKKSFDKTESLLATEKKIERKIKPAIEDYKKIIVDTYKKGPHVDFLLQANTLIKKSEERLKLLTKYAFNHSVTKEREAPFYHNDSIHNGFISLATDFVDFEYRLRDYLKITENSDILPNFISEVLAASKPKEIKSLFEDIVINKKCTSEALTKIFNDDVSFIDFSSTILKQEETVDVKNQLDTKNKPKLRNILNN